MNQVMSKEMQGLDYTMLLILKNKQTILKSIKDAFEGKDIQTQYNDLGQRIDLYFHKHKLAIQVDELGMLTEILVIKLKDKKYLYVYVSITVLFWQNVHGARSANIYLFKV